MYPDGQRLSECGHRRRQAIGHLQREQLIDDHLLRVTTVVPVGVSESMQALCVERHRHADDNIADFKVVAPRAELGNFATELVPHDRVVLRLEWFWCHRIIRRGSDQFGHRRPHLCSVPQHVQIAAADPAGENSGECLPRPGCWVGNFVDSHLPFAHHCCSHRRSVGE